MKLHCRTLASATLAAGLGASTLVAGILEKCYTYPNSPAELLDSCVQYEPGVCGGDCYYLFSIGVTYCADDWDYCGGSWTFMSSFQYGICDVSNSCACFVDPNASYIHKWYPAHCVP
jgi:hypothetical protein